MPCFITERFESEKVQKIARPLCRIWKAIQSLVGTVSADPTEPEVGPAAETQQELAVVTTTVDVQAEAETVSRISRRGH